MTDDGVIHPEGQKIIEVFVSLLEVQDQRLDIREGGRISTTLSHQPGLRAASSEWQLPKSAPISGELKRMAADEGVDRYMFLPYGQHVLIVGSLSSTGGSYSTDEVLDSSYLIGSAPDLFPTTTGSVRTIREVRRKFVRVAGVWAPNGAAPNLSRVERASAISTPSLGDLESGAVREAVDGFVVQIAVG